jgi:predicted ATP-grasp superfamily ATP-dependent carboligase
VGTHEYNTPIVILNCGLGALAIARSLGCLGAPIHIVDSQSNNPTAKSRYCLKVHPCSFSEEDPRQYLECLKELSVELGRKAVLIPTTDELAIFVADYVDQLKDDYIYPENSSDLVRELANKKSMFGLAGEHGLPTPRTLFPTDLADLKAFAGRVEYPVMLKGIMGNRLQELHGCKMLLVNNPTELQDAYKRLEEHGSPNLMIQEYIPGGDDQVYIFNGYFDARSDCLAGFTGFKIRQHPIHFGSASLGECRWIPEVAELTTRFLKAVDYRGIIDIGYRLDPRDGQYKVLDINPRIGQAFRLFIASNGMDVSRALYLDLTDQPVYCDAPIEGRRWLIEDNDLVSSWHYYREGTLGFWSWFSAFYGLQETAWFRWNDPLPFLAMFWRFLKRTGAWFGKVALQSKKEEPLKNA